MATLKQVRVQLLDATNKPIENVDVKTSAGAVYLPDGSSLKSWIETSEVAHSEFQRKLAAHAAMRHVTPDKVSELLCGEPSYDSTTGILTFPKEDGTNFTLDTMMEKVFTNWRLGKGNADGPNAGRDCIILVTADGVEQELDVTKLIDVYTGNESDTAEDKAKKQILISVDGNKKIQASVVEGSISEKFLDAALMAKINVVYELPTASATEKGGVKVSTGSGLAVDAGTAQLTLLAPTGDAIGGVKKGAGVDIDANGVIKAIAPTGEDLGAVKQGAGVSIDADGIIKTIAPTGDDLGAVKKGNGIDISAEGVISAANITIDGTKGALDITSASKANADIVVKMAGDSIQVVGVGGTVAPLTVTAEITGGAGTATYQWYKKKVGTDIAFVAITDATTASYTPASTEKSETIYYCCVGATGVVADPVPSKRVTIVVE